MKKTLSIIVFLVIANAIFAQNTSNAETHYNQGIALGNKGEYDAAIKSFTQAIRINQYYENAFIKRGYLYQTVYEYKNAIGDYNKALAINPRNNEALLNRGLCYFFLFGITYVPSNLDQASNDFITVLSSNPKDEIAQKFLGLIRQIEPIGLIISDEFINSLSANTRNQILPLIRNLQEMGFVKKDNIKLPDRQKKVFELLGNNNYTEVINECNKVFNMDDSEFRLYSEDVIMETLFLHRLLRGMAFLNRLGTGKGNNPEDIFRARYDAKQILDMDPNQPQALQLLQSTDRFIR